MSVFVAKYRSTTGCPRCGEHIKVGQEAEFQPRDWPWDSGSGMTKKEPLWHAACVRKKLVESLCPACRLLHKDHGSCLL